jgi:hypothetical protein
MQKGVSHITHQISNDAEMRSPARKRERRTLTAMGCDGPRESELEKASALLQDACLDRKFGDSGGGGEREDQAGHEVMDDQTD